jgi:hypothetical protein
MSAPTHTVLPLPRRTTGRAAQVRLPWWALALPLAAFAALLLFPLTGTGTGGAGGSEDGSAGRSTVSQVVDRVQQVLARG